MAAHPGVADHQVLDRGPLGVAEVERARDVRRRLDDRERRQGRVGRRAGAVGREDVRREPALVDRALDIVRRIGLRQARVIGSLVLPRNKRPARPADERVVVPPAGSASGPAAHRGRPGSGALATRYRASAVTARERPSRRRCPRGSHRPALARGPSRRYSSGHRREAGSVARARWRPGRCARSARRSRLARRATPA